MSNPTVIAKKLQPQGRSFEERFGKHIDRMPRAASIGQATVQVFGGMADHSVSLFVRPIRRRSVDKRRRIGAR